MEADRALDSTALTNPFRSSRQLLRTPSRVDRTIAAAPAMRDIQLDGVENSATARGKTLDGGKPASGESTTTATATVTTTNIPARLPTSSISQRTVLTTHQPSVPTPGGQSRQRTPPPTTTQAPANPAYVRRPGEKLLRTPPATLANVAVTNAARQTLVQTANVIPPSVLSSPSGQRSSRSPLQSKAGFAAPTQTLQSTSALRIAAITPANAVLDENDQAFLRQSYLEEEYRQAKAEIDKLERAHQSTRNQIDLLEFQVAKVDADTALVMQEPVALLKQIQEAGLDTATHGGLNGLMNAETVRAYETQIKRQLRMLSVQMEGKFSSLRDMEQQHEQRRELLEAAKLKARTQVHALAQELVQQKQLAEATLHKAYEELEQKRSDKPIDTIQVAQLVQQQATLSHLQGELGRLRVQLAALETSPSDGANSSLNADDERCQRLIRRVALFVKRYEALQASKDTLRSLVQRC